MKCKLPFPSSSSPHTAHPTAQPVKNEEHPAAPTPHVSAIFTTQYIVGLDGIHFGFRNFRATQRHGKPNEGVEESPTRSFLIPPPPSPPSSSTIEQTRPQY